MNKDLTLLVLAAGMGSRFGGLKQIEPVGPNGEFIIDYSVYDAIKAGFTKVVFVIKEENYEIFKETIGKRIEDKIKVEYAFQDNKDVPEDVHIPSERVKPLGTAHAIYATRNKIAENFATINADDFYGRDAYMKAAEFLKNCQDDEYAMVAYEVGKTLTENGAVKRGVITSENGYLKDIDESSLEEVDGMVKGYNIFNNKKIEVSLDHPVSMNLFCLTPKLIDYVQENISDYFHQKDLDLMNDEYFLPIVVVESSKKNNKQVRVLTTTSKYYGMTYKEDLDKLKDFIQKEVESGNYNSNLWG